LWIVEERSTADDDTPPTEATERDSVSTAALEGLGLAVFVSEPSGLRLAGTPPEWLGRVWPSVVSARDNLAEASPFLENFLTDAAECWSAGIGHVRSGPWVEYDRQGTEINLEATALTGGGRALLVIESLGEHFEATRSILQKARETMLSYQRLAQPHPPEISISLDRLRELYPDYTKCGFLIMRFTATQPYQRILNAITDTARSHGLHILRADEHDFHSDLLSNVRTYLHGCSFGIAVYERIESEEHNANVALEVGYLMALNKPVLLLKDRTVRRLQTDLVGRLCRTFDPFNPEGTIPPQLTKWFEEYGIAVPHRQ
jgi:hypothetical protein